MLFRKNNKIVHFIHIPKCGGSAIIDLLISNGYENDLEYFKRGQHQCYDEYVDFIKHLKIDYSFAVVRHPIDRMLSELYYIIKERNKLNTHKKINLSDITSQSIVHYLHGMLINHLIPENFKTDNNHWLPQYKFIHRDVNVYKLEEVDKLLTDLKAHNIIGETSLLKKINCSFNNKVNIDWNYSQDVTKVIFESYYNDFKIFNYKIPDNMQNNLNKKTSK
jgi:hypothetical protein